MLEELMRRCREDSYDPTYQDLVALREHLKTPVDVRIALLEDALAAEHSRFVAAKRLISEDRLRAEFEKLANDSYGFRQGRRGSYVNPTTATRWKYFKLGAEFARAVG